MKSHQGAISVYSQPGEGTISQLCFPVVETAARAGDIECQPMPRAGQNILFVDDEARGPAWEKSSWKAWAIR